MGKKYVMFVDERVLINTNKRDSLSMIGVIFEYDYCIDLKNNQSELSAKLNRYRKEILSDSYFNNMPLDDIILRESVYKNIDKAIMSKFINELPTLLKDLQFTIITSTVKKDLNKVNDSYSVLTKKLLKKFYSFIIRKNGDSGGIIIESKEGNSSYKVQQNFFNIYNEKNIYLSIVGNTQDKINTFIVCEKNNKAYGLGIEVLNIVYNIISRVTNGYRELDMKLLSYIEYGSKDRIFNGIRYKIYNDMEFGILRNQLLNGSYNNIEGFSKELKRLREQLSLKDIRIEEKEKEINELFNEIQLLNQELEEMLFNRKSDSIISRILSDIDIKMNGFDKVITVGKIR